MGNRPPNIDRFVRLMSKYLPIRPHIVSKIVSTIMSYVSKAAMVPESLIITGIMNIIV